MSTAMLRQELQLLRREGLAPWALIALTLLLVAAALNGRALLGVQARTAAALEDDPDQALAWELQRQAMLEDEEQDD